MTRMLIIGLVWLSISAFVGALIGFAIHRADLRDDQFPPAPSTPDDEPVELDWYLQHWSVALDLVILWRAVRGVLRRSAVH